MADQNSADRPDIDGIVARLQERVAQRRAEGAYPPGLEHDLDSHFHRIVAHRSDEPYDFAEIKDRMKILDAQMAFSRARIPLASGMPVTDAAHKVVDRVVARQIDGVLHQVFEFADGVREILRCLLAALEDPHSHMHAELVGQIDAVFDRLATYERAPADSGVAVADLRRRVEALEDAEDKRRFEPWYDAETFETRFRGAPDELQAQYRDLASAFAGLSPVLDIGCGRGEFLDLLREVGVTATGVESDGRLAVDAAARGLEVVHGDGLQVLSERDDESLGGVALVRVIEHLTPQEVLDLIALAAAKLRRGGRVVVETVNPQSLYVFSHAFYVDPTHTTPVHPEYLRFLFEQAGFSDVKLEWRSAPPEDDVLVEPTTDGDVGAENVRRLNRLLFAPQDYAVIATR